MLCLVWWQESKGVQLLIEAFSEVLSSMPDARGTLSRALDLVAKASRSLAARWARARRLVP